MKKLIILAFIAIATGTSAFAGTNAATTKVNEHFAASFSKARNVSWKSDSRFEKVSFEMGNEKVNAFYDTDGDLIGTSKNISFDKLPKASLETITTKYTFPEYQVKDVMEFTNASNEKNYYVSFQKGKESLVLEITKSGIVSVFAGNKK